MTAKTKPKRHVMWAVPWVGSDDKMMDINKSGAAAIYGDRTTAIERCHPYRDRPVKVLVTITAAPRKRKEGA